MTSFDKVSLIIVITAGILQFACFWYLFKGGQHTVAAFVLIILMFLGQLVLFYGSFVEPQWIEVKHENINIASKGSQLISLKIAVISDHHLGPYKQEAFAARTVEIINQENVDLVLIPGDFIFNDASYAGLLDPLGDLRAKYGIYAVLGNHDYGTNRRNRFSVSKELTAKTSAAVENKLEELGINVLRDKIEVVKIGEQEIVIAGLEDLWGDQSGFEQVFNDLDESAKVILLEHNPDIILDERSGIADLIISGHTHGGQLRFPLIGPLYPIPTKLGREYKWGQFDTEFGSKLYITKGVGEIGPRARLMCRPEIVFLEVNL